MFKIIQKSSLFPLRERKNSPRQISSTQIYPIRRFHDGSKQNARKFEENREISPLHFFPKIFQTYSKLNETPGEKFGIVKFISRSLPLTRSDAITRSPLDEAHDLPFDTGGEGSACSALHGRHTVFSASVSCPKDPRLLSVCRIARGKEIEKDVKRSDSPWTQTFQTL